MPYIDKQAREYLMVGGELPDTPGELNFVLSTILKRYMEDHGLSYQTINDIIGALECLKMEFYRRIAQPYEDQKKEANGDVF